MDKILKRMIGVGLITMKQRNLIMNKTPEQSSGRSGQ
jgi:hypothetical protein